MSKQHTQQPTLAGLHREVERQEWAEHKRALREEPEYRDTHAQHLRAQRAAQRKWRGKA